MMIAKEGTRHDYFICGNRNSSSKFCRRCDTRSIGISCQPWSEKSIKKQKEIVQKVTSSNEVTVHNHNMFY